MEYHRMLLLGVFAVTCCTVTAQYGGDRGVLSARANIRPSIQKSFPERVTGTVTLSQSSWRSTTIRVVLNGLKPNSVHGFHVHTLGQLSIAGQGCLGAGGHFNPFNRMHGGRGNRVRHVGDLGNLKADGHGKVGVTFRDRLVSLRGMRSVLGRSFVVHELADDLGRGTGSAAAESKKTGNAGSRLACGQIFLSAP